MADYVLEDHPLAYFPFSREYDEFTLPPGGAGYLAGEFPGGITTVDGVPVPATVRVLYRPPAGAPGDGVVVAQVKSALDGTWRVAGLNPALTYDVVGRKQGYNDVIQSGVRPEPIDFTFSLTSTLSMNEDSSTVGGSLTVNNGKAPFTISVIEGSLPAGLAFVRESERKFVLQGESQEAGRFTFTVQVEDADGFTARASVALGMFLIIRPVDETKTRFIALLDDLPGVYRSPSVSSPTRTWNQYGQLALRGGKVKAVELNGEGYLQKPLDTSDVRYYSDGIASVWFQVTRPLPNDTAGLISFYTDDYDRVTSICMDPQGRILGGIRSFYGPEAHVTPGRYDDGQWHHAVLMFWRSEGSHINLVIDNQLVYTAGLSGLADAAGGLREVQVGRDHRLFGPRLFPGALTRMRYVQLKQTPQQGQNIWNDLPENRAQVAELYNEVAGILRPT